MFFQHGYSSLLSETCFQPIKCIVNIDKHQITHTTKLPSALQLDLWSVPVVVKMQVYLIYEVENA